VGHLFDPGGHFFPGTAIYYVDLFCPEAQGHAGRIHGHIASTHHCYDAGFVDRGCGPAGVVGLHKISPGKILVGAEDPHEVFSGTSEEFRQPCPDTHKGRIKTIFFQKLLKGPGSSYEKVGFYPDPHFGKEFDFGFHNPFGESELGDPIDHHSTRFVEGLKEDDLMAFSGHVGRDGDARGAGTYDGYPFARLWLYRRWCYKSLFPFPIGHKTLEPADRDRFVNVFKTFAHGTFKLALFFLGTYPATYGGQKIGLFYCVNGGLKVALLDFPNKPGNRYLHRTTLHTGGILALEASFCFESCLGFGVPQGYLFHIMGPFLGILRGHFLGGDGEPFPGSKGPRLFFSEQFL